MDPMTQSAQISSSQGFADGQNSAAKESKLSDSFLSSSPVSLIQSPQDKRVVLGSDKPCEGVATSLRFPSQPGSFTPGKYGSEAGPPDGQPDSPIKTSPVSERIKALEALAAKKKEPDFRSDGGYSHFRDRHHEKSPTEPTKSPIETTKSPTETTKTPVEKTAPTVQKRGGSVEPESPESPFEVLGDLKQVGEFEETEEWMKAHLPPVPDLDAVGLTKGPQTTDSVPSKEGKETDVVVPDAPEAFAGVPDAFMDSPVEAPEVTDKFSDSQKQPSVEDESEFDLSFLPTAYMWDQQEKPGVQPPSNVSSVVPASPAPPAGFDSPSSPVLPPVATDIQSVPGEVKPSWTGDLEPPETSEVDSSGESDDTVIEDGVSVPPSSQPALPNEPSSTDPTASAAQSPPSEEKETPPPRSERKLMQVPTINVIETDEPNYSDEEMEMEAEEEDYEVVKDAESSITPESEDYKNEPPKTRPIETEFMEGYSPPSSPVDSDAEYSPKHKILKPLPETDSQVSEQQPEDLPTQADSKVLASDFTEAQSDKSQPFSNKANDEPFVITNEEVDFPDNDDEWSDEAQEILVKPTKADFALEQNPYGDFRVDEKNSTVTKDPYMEGSSIPKTSFMQDDIYDRQSFDYDYDASSPLDDIDDKGLNDKDHLLSDSSQIHVETLSPSTAPSDKPNIDDFTSLNDETLSKPVTQPSLRDYPEDPYSSFQMGTLSSVTEQDFNKKVTGETDSIANGDSIPGQKFHTKAAENPDLESSVSEPSDSFVDFMRECLKSRQDEEADEAYQGVTSRSELCKTGMPPSQSPPSMVMDLEQEQLTISVLKELGSSQEEENVVSVKSSVPSQDQVSSNQGSIEQSSITSVPNPPCSQSNRVFGSTYSEEVDAIDEWVAEAYHLAEHVLTAILTHLSVKDLIHWRDPKKSGVVFGVSMLMLLSLAAFSIISVVSYLLLALLCVTITFRIYKSVVQAVQKSSEGHPFKALIDKDVSIPPETFRKHVDTSLTYINRGLKQMSRLFLVEDLVDSLKLAVVMWLFTYVGAVFNGITILILADILLFAIPPIYEKNKTQIDQYIDLARTQINTTMAKLQEKLPGAMKRSKTE